MAAGFSIEKENFPELLTRVNLLAAQRIDPKNFVRTLEIDLAIPSRIITTKLISDLDKLRPYGLGNNQPVFASFNLGLSNLREVGKENQHISLRLFDGDNFYRAVLFNASDLNLNLSEGEMVNIAYTVKENVFNGNTYLDLVLKDIQKSA